jgi:hypothetical protein
MAPLFCETVHSSHVFGSSVDYAPFLIVLYGSLLSRLTRLSCVATVSRGTDELYLPERYVCGTFRSCESVRIPAIGEPCLSVYRQSPSRETVWLYMCESCDEVSDADLDGAENIDRRLNQSGSNSDIVWTNIGV